jgi:hypothetical protein
MWDVAPTKAVDMGDGTHGSRGCGTWHPQKSTIWASSQSSRSSRSSPQANRSANSFLQAFHASTAWSLVYSVSNATALAGSSS